MASRSIAWREWSTESFEEARKANKLVLLDLTATWCHWCHVMDEGTYSDPRVVEAINVNFVPIRVDIDRRPDISERYNRGGFPTIAFLSDRGESVWGATYIPPADMLRIIGSILRAKASGEIDQALERGRMHYLDLAKATERRTPVPPSDIEDLFEDMFTAYDVEHGGFGTEPKFPNPDMLDLLLMRYVSTSDDELGDAAVNTLEQMVEGLYDRAEAGLFRYSVTRDWSTPHYEKMLETNLGFLANILHAKMAIGGGGFDPLARGTAKYIIDVLHDPDSGGFYGSQDADEEYYKLDAAGRRGKSPPKVDRSIYAGWNAKAAATMLVAGAVLSDERFTDAGLKAWKFVSSRLWDPELRLVRHAEGQDLYLLEDQSAYLEALTTVVEMTGDRKPLENADALIFGVDKAFAHEDGGYGDVMVSKPDAIGALDTPKRPLVDNSKLALGLMRLSAISHRADLMERARAVLESFTRKEVDSYGIFGASFVMARTVLDRGTITVDIHSDGTDKRAVTELWLSASSVCDPGTVVMMTKDTAAPKPFAIVCGASGCSDRISVPARLRDRVIAEVRKGV